MPYQRIVCFKFKAGTSEEAIQQHMADFAAMQTGIPQIQEYRGGGTHPGDYNRPPDYDTMHYMTFASLEDIDIYFNHPVHKHFIERNRSIWDNVLVLNSDIDA